jgi:4-diphosphocytidyl-2C-methyl-D-erythritol kinase
MSGRAARTVAQAKINLALRVLGREKDGYHSIETVFLRLELGDDVAVRTTNGARSLRCEAMRGEPVEKNLAYRAAALFSQETGWPLGFEIAIEKRIPIGGGLGGGSADAAAVLRILNCLSPNPVPSEHLLAFAERLGSDVPFLTSDLVMALSWGRGEKMLELKPLPSRDVQLFSPSFGIPTGDAYGALAAARGAYPHRTPKLTAEMFADWDSAAANSVNDFESVIRSGRSEIDGLLSGAERSGLFCRMSGSGSTVFRISGVRTQSAEPEGGPGPVVVPLDMHRITTRTAQSVVPVQLLD